MPRLLRLPHLDDRCTKPLSEGSEISPLAIWKSTADERHIYARCLHNRLRFCHRSCEAHLVVPL
jgi:hypothetical protein